jgi:hypothetical protein
MSERISITPDVCNGRTVIRGTRILVNLIAPLNGLIAPPGDLISPRMNL